MAVADNPKNLPRRFAEALKMNIDDTATEGIVIPPIETILPAVWAMQHEMAKNYGPIERKNGHWYPDPGLSIEDGQFQHWVKGQFWRVTEELCEALEDPVYAMDEWRIRYDKEPKVRHFFEELADAMHFFVEVTILCGFPEAVLQQSWDRMLNAKKPKGISFTTTNRIIHEIIIHLGLAANRLKNKPWKLTQMPTDEARFHERVVKAWDSFMFLWQYLGCQRQDIYLLYFKKHAVNAFRIRSNY